MTDLFGEELKAINRRRYEVVRTRHDEERAEISTFVRQLVHRRDNYRCTFCGSSDRQLVLDHIIPWSAGGSDEVDNLRTLCWDCNEERSNYATPDDLFRRTPRGICVYCNPSGYEYHEDLQPIICPCGRKAPGLAD